MSQLETAMALLMKTFDTYADKAGKKDTLSKKEVKTLLVEELFLVENREEVDGLLEKLDRDGDSEVNFSEFMELVASMTCIIHDICPKK